MAGGFIYIFLLLEKAALLKDNARFAAVIKILDTIFSYFCPNELLKSRRRTFVLRYAFGEFRTNMSG